MASRSPEPPAEVAAGKEEKEEKQPRTLETALAGLAANTLYHYRLVAENEYGTTDGQDRTFTTSGPPRIAYEPSTGIGQEEATIHAKVDPDQIATTYRFQYGQTHSVWQRSARGGQSIGSGSSPVAVFASLTSLKVGTTYHYRVLAENEAGIDHRSRPTFATVPSAPVDATFVTGVSSNEATLHTQINPLGNDTSYNFQYGTQSCQANPSSLHRHSLLARRHRRRQRRRAARSQAHRAHPRNDLPLSRP